MNEHTTEHNAPTTPRKRRSFVRDGLMVFSGQGAHVILNFLLGVLTVNIWSDAVLGRIRIAQVATQIAGVLGDMGMAKVLPYELGRNERDVRHTIRVVLALWLISSIVITMLAIIPYLVPGLFNTTWWWGVLAAAIIPGVLLISYTRGITLGTQRIGVFANLGWLRDIVAVAFVVGLGIFAGLSDPEYGWIRILAAVMASLVMIGYCVWVLTRVSEFGLAFDFPLMGSLLRRGIIFAFGGMLMRLNYRVDILILGLAVFAIPTGDIGQYSLAASLAQFVWQIPIALGHLVISRGVRTKDPLGFARKNARLARMGTFVAIVAATAFAIVAPWVTEFLFRNIKEANEIHIYIWILLPGVVAFIPARLFEADLIARNRPWSINAVMAPVVVLNIVLNVILIPSDFQFNGAKGAALASTITYTIGTIVMTIIYARRTGLSLLEVVTPTFEDFEAIMRPIRSRLS